uniref:Glycine N-acyltransferase-like protein n=1 Tax=Lynx canadensis TaxID=61383 RepID=A0A667HQ63_LYNCA
MSKAQKSTLLNSEVYHKMSQPLPLNLPTCLFHIPHVYGAVFNIKNKNPFNMEVLVDAWPDYQIVITRPQREVRMKDDLDHYTNTYQIFTKAPDKLEEVLARPQVINWDQVFQIQGCQESLQEAIRKISASKSVQVDYVKTILIMTEIDLKTDEFLKTLSPGGSFQNISLDPSHAGLVNEQWTFGKNDRSLKYIERCLQNFPGFGVLGPEGRLISWIVMEQSCEMRMGYTVPKYQKHGYMKKTSVHLMNYVIQKKVSCYFHMSEHKEESNQALRDLKFKAASCGWHQWKCSPEKYC